MRDVIVAVDLETTGLDVSDSHIIEIGAVKFRGGEVLETFTTLVDPGMPIPSRITGITGIRPEDMVGAPKLAEVLPRFTAFVDGAVILGHNIDFDLRFLNKAGALKGSAAIDTYDLASVLLPATPRYNLNALMQELNLTPEGSYHRALADAMATARVYMTLWQRLLHETPLELIREIITITQNLPWRGLLAFTDALQAREADLGTEPAAPKSERELFSGTSATRPTSTKSAPSPTASPLTLDPQQAEIAAVVTDALTGNQHVLLEADEEIGGTHAYLTAAAAWAIQHDERVVIATPTGELAYDPAWLPAGTRVSFLKSREHYLCPGRLRVLRRRLPTSVEELRVLAKALTGLYLIGAAAGDRDSISLRGPGEYAAWGRLSAQDEECSVQRCEAHMEGICPFFKARQAAEEAHLVVTSHGLMIADADAQGAGGAASEDAEDQSVLPPYERVIIDGAHDLEETATNGLRTRLEASTIKVRLADMGTGRRGLLGNVTSSLQPAISPKLFEQLKSFIGTMATAIAKLDHHVDQMFKALYSFLEATDHLSNSDFVVYVRLTHNLRQHVAFGPVREQFSILSEFTDTLTSALERLSAQLGTLRGKFAIDDLEDLIAGTHAAAAYLKKLQTALHHTFTAPQENTNYWLEFARDNFRLSILAAPILIGKMIERHVWSARQSAVLISPTLRTHTGFDFVRERFAAPRERVAERVVSTPHDYTQTLMLFLPTDMPEPTERERYQKALERTIIELATTTQGRLLGLFTSFTQLRQSAQNISARLALGDITVFDQSDGTSQQVLMEGFRNTPKAVLLGTRSLWEEGQYAPDDLAVTVITRLPFAVPTDPLVSARGDLLENSFNDYMIPDAVLKLRQGVGRRKRGTAAQKGVVVILDKRVVSKGYGKLFIDSLPPCTIVKGTLSELAVTVQRWLGTS